MIHRKPSFKWIIAMLLLMAPFFLQAQLQTADDLYENKHYQEALEKYKKAAERDPTNGEILFKLANCYKLTGNTDEAEVWYSEATQYYDDDKVKLFYAQMLLSNGKYKLAEKWFINYAKSISDPNNANNAMALAKHCQWLDSEGIKFEKYKVKPAPFNSEKLDFSPTYFGKNKIIFASNRPLKKGGGGEEDPWTSDRFVDLFEVPVFNRAGFGEPKPFSKIINSKYHEGPATVTADGLTMFFTRTDIVKGKRGFDSKKNTHLKIFKANLEGEDWVMAEDLTFNNSQFSTCHPTLSADGETMIFASDRPGGFGGMDLFMCVKEGTGWSQPENLGADINTEGNEVFPFYHADRTLYFSSDLLVGFGGLDIFYSTKLGNEWMSPRNMGAPINSPRDDYGFIVDEQHLTGMFSTNRNTTGDNIFTFESVARVTIKGIVVNCLTGEPIPDAEVSLVDAGFGDEISRTDKKGAFELELPLNGRFEIIAEKLGYIKSDECQGTSVFTTFDLEPDAVIELDLPLKIEPAEVEPKWIVSGKVINAEYETPLKDAVVTLVSRCSGEEIDFTTFENGRYSFPIYESCDYILKAYKDKFLPFELDFSTLALREGEAIKFTLPLEMIKPKEITPEIKPVEGMVLEMYHIYFDYNKSDIRSDAVPDLRILLALLKKYPDVKGELTAHTDSRGTHEYNDRLSQRRADAAYKYLTLNGISADRVVARGYGEYMLKNDCVDAFPCSEEEHQRNRRLEFKVLSVSDPKESKEREYFEDHYTVERNWNDVPDDKRYGPKNNDQQEGQYNNDEVSQKFKASGAIFTVEFASSMHKLSEEEYDGFYIEEYREFLKVFQKGKSHIYYIGDFSSMTEARMALIKMKQYGYPGAKLVGYNDGQRMGQSELEELMFQ